MNMLGRGECDEKIICVHLDDPAFNRYHHINELPEHRLRELRRFFEDDKVLEHKEVFVQDFLGPEETRQAVARAAAHYREVMEGTRLAL
jgi:inorganic pyrophosphatase